MSLLNLHDMIDVFINVNIGKIVNHHKLFQKFNKNHYEIVKNIVKINC